MLPGEVLQFLSERSPRDALFTVDGGLSALHAQTNLSLHPQRRLLTTIRWITPGYALPAAIGAAMAGPDRSILCLTSGRSLLMNAQELAVCALRQLPIVLFVAGHPEDRSRPDFPRLAEAYGLQGASCSNLEELNVAWGQAEAARTTFLIECKAGWGAQS
ncbi:thiamine pyrophosphate-dependent enzyme [Paenibacillus koleovorans]|uniref:thiamine pyrophosphate-dependent enzyme n=1 Tax=Paenibacillus koleovorans TaxID=121608 RepID=UPI001FE60106|nr:thiamine pyrophosphate-dependent enzyme [Paenibacillus koleovorans]